jgi:hypothetical protein
MKIKTAELTGKPLDWALAQACGHVVDISYGGGVCIQGLMGWQNFEGHTDPATCMNCFGFESGQVSELFADSDLCCYVARGYSAIYTLEMVHGSGDTPEQAVARCVVAMRLGDEVDVPDELCGVSV